MPPTPGAEPAQALGAVVRAYESKSRFFAGHSGRVAALAVRLAGACALDAAETEALGVAGLLHDIGMIAVPDELLARADDLSDKEHVTIQRHPEVGAAILAAGSTPDRIGGLILEHHERVDGSGYPLGLSGRKISSGGRILGLAETWVALTEARPYRGGLGVAEALGVLDGASQFDPEMFAALVRVVRGE